MVFSLAGGGARPKASLSGGTGSAAAGVGSAAVTVGVAIKGGRAGDTLDGFDPAVTSNKLDTVNFDHDAEDGNVKREEEDTIDGHD